MEHKWYIIHTLSGGEREVKRMIQDQASKNGMSDYFQEVVIPSVEISEIQRGKKVKVEKKIMPSYILVKMKMDDKAWHMINKIPKVTGFLGNRARPNPVPESEVKRVFDQLEVTAKDAALAKRFNIGEEVKVVDGPFESFVGVIEEVEEAKSRLRVSVTIFGRITPLDLAFDQVKKNNN